MTGDLRELAWRRSGSLENIVLQSDSGLLGAAAPPGSSGRLTYYLFTANKQDVVCLPDGLVGNIVNLKPINGSKELNVFLDIVQAKLPSEGIYVGCVETQQLEPAGLEEQQPWVWAFLLEIWTFISKSLFSKSLFSKTSSFQQCTHRFFRGKRTQLMTRAEVLGRLIYAGYDIVEYRDIDQLFYFFAMKN